MKNNPFYILRLNYTAQRKEIVSACEDLSFYTDATKCVNAQNILLHPKKRLTAELDWFLGCDANKMHDIVASIEKGTTIHTIGMSSLALLNALVYNFDFIDEAEILNIEDGILNIDFAFGKVDSESIIHTLNAFRTQAKMTEVSQYDVDVELDRKRTRIRQVVSKKLSTLDFYSYIKLISGIAEKLYENDQPDVGYILSDLFQDYQIKTKDAVTNELNDIHQRIEHIKANYDPDSEVDVTLIIKKLDHWKLLAHPIQILEQINGTSFEENNALCRYLNELVIWLTKEGFVDQAAEISNKAQETFLDEEKSNSFYEYEQAIFEHQRLKKLHDDILESVETIQNDFDCDKDIIDSKDIESFAISLKKELIKARVLIEIPNAYNDCVGSIAIAMRDTSIYLSNEKGKVFSALLLTSCACTIFKNIPEWYAVFEKDKEQINSIYNEQRSTVNSWVENLQLYEKRSIPFRSIEDVKQFMNECYRINTVVQEIEFESKYVDACRYLICLTTQIVISNTIKKNFNEQFVLALMQFAVEQFGDVPNFKEQAQRYREHINKRMNRTVVDDIKDIGKGILNFFGF